MTTQYTEGTARALVRDDTAVLLPGPVASGVVDRVWEALSTPAQGGVVAVVGALTQAAGGLVDVPPFAVAESDAAGGTVRVAVRGATACVRVRTGSDASDPVEISGAGVLMWAERVVEDSVSVELVADQPGEEPQDTEVWPLVGGVVRARAVRRVLDPDRAARVEAAAAAGVLDEPGPEVQASPDPEGPAVGAPLADRPTDRPTGRVGLAPVGLAPVGLAPVDEVPSQETLLDSPSDSDVADASDDADHVEESDDSGASDALDDPDEVDDPDAPPQVGDRISADVSPVEGRAGESDGYEHLFGETVFRQIEDAAVRAAEEQEGEPGEEPAEQEAAPAPAPDPAPVAPPVPEPTWPPSVSQRGPEPAPHGPDAPAPPSPAQDSGLISGVPQGRAVPDPVVSTAGPEAAPDPGEVDDHDGQTIMTSELAALRAAAGSAPQFTVPAPTGALEVLALPCPAGHPNPPTRELCRTCGVALEGEPRTAPRPALGRVLVTTSTSEGNQSVDLDRDVVVGRRPRTSTTSADKMPRMVAVPSPQKDVSRSHVQVTLEEWHVLVEDLATTNGTVLLRPGQQPRRLHPNQKEIVVDGDVLDLGDGVTVTFDGIW